MTDKHTAKLKFTDGHILDSDDNFIVVDINARPCDIDDIIKRYNSHDALVEALKNIKLTAEGMELNYSVENYEILRRGFVNLNSKIEAALKAVSM